MRTKKILAILLAVFITISLFSGCSSIGVSDADIMRPPKATGEKAEIQNVIEKAAGGDYVLKYPKNGEHRSAIITADLSGNGNEEAIVFYRPSTETTSVNILFISEIDGEWKAVKSFKNQNAEIDRVFISDIDKDNFLELVVGWTSFVPGANQVTYYKLMGNDVSQIALEDTYSEMMLGDITGDGNDDLALLSLPNEEKKEHNIVLYGYSQHKFRKIDQISANNNVASYASVKSGKINAETNALFIDGKTANTNEIITSAIYYDQTTKRLKDPLNEKLEGGGIANKTLRNATSYCRDIDEDGIMEIPVAEMLTGVTAQEKENISSIIAWKKIDVLTGALSQVARSVANYADGYYFILPKSWETHVYATNNTEKRTLRFLVQALTVQADNSEEAELINIQQAQAENNVESTRLLLTIKTFPQQDWNNTQTNNEAEGFVEIMTASGLVYAAKLGSNEILEDLNISEQMVRENFNLITG